MDDRFWHSLRNDFCEFIELDGEIFIVFLKKTQPLELISETWFYNFGQILFIESLCSTCLELQ